MNILTKSKRTVKSTVLGASTLALLITPGAALAHGSGGDSHQGPSMGTGQQQAHRQDGDNQRHDQDHNKPQNPQSCAERQQSLNNRAAAFSDRFQKQLNGFNIILSGIQAGVGNGAFTIDNYDALNTQATADQTSATNAISAVTAPQLDCNDPTSWDKAQSDFNANVKTAKQALKTYRHDVLSLFEAAVNS